MMTLRGWAKIGARGAAFTHLCLLATCNQRSIVRSVEYAVIAVVLWFVTCQGSGFAK